MASIIAGESVPSGTFAVEMDGFSDLAVVKGSIKKLMNLSWFL